MKTMKFTFWRDGDYYLGFWNDYPDYQAQGMSKKELIGNLSEGSGPRGILRFAQNDKDLLADFASGEVLYIRKVEELVVAE